LLSHFNFPYFSEATATNHILKMKAGLAVSYTYRHRYTSCSFCKAQQNTSLRI
jgi:hypothetical protein